MPTRLSFMRAAVVAALWTFPLSYARATAIHWTGAGGDDNWYTAENWTPSQVPANIDDAVIAGNVDVVVNASSPSIVFNSLRLGDSNGATAPTLEIATGINSSGTLLINPYAVLIQRGMSKLLLGGLRIASNGVLTHVSNGRRKDTFINLHVFGDFQLEHNAIVDANFLGYIAGYCDPYACWDWGWGPGGSDRAASHGGNGGGGAYDSLIDPIDLGSGGGRGYPAGGGAIILDVEGTLFADGVISANGGAGGTINIKAGTIKGSGKLQATGVRGGGGRIALRSQNIYQGNISFDASGNEGGAGTIYLHDPAQSKLIIAEGILGTPISAMIVGSDTLSIDSLSIINASAESWGVNLDLNLLYMNEADLSSYSPEFVIKSSAVFSGLNNLFVNNLAAPPSGLTLTSGTSLIQRSSASIAISNLTMDGGSLITHSGPSSRISLNVFGDMNLRAGALIDARGLGNGGGYGPGAGESRSIGGGGGGGYGGAGGAGYHGGSGGQIYGSSTTPADLGSGGGNGGGAGGGIVKLNVGGQLNVDGAIRADGGIGTGSGGGGSGGSIQITASTITGGGIVSANGGNGGINEGGGGGGGRISLVASVFRDFLSTMTVDGGLAGSAGAEPGGIGTIYLNGDIVVTPPMASSHTATVSSSTSSATTVSASTSTSTTVGPPGGNEPTIIATTGTASNQSGPQRVGALGGTYTYILPAGPVQVQVPPGAFLQPVDLSVMQAASFPAPRRAFPVLHGTGIGLQIEVQEAQPAKPVTLVVPFKPSDTAGLNARQLYLFRYDVASANWVMLPSVVDTTSNTVTARVDHFSLFQVMAIVPASTVSSVRAFPNPLRPSQGHANMTFAMLPANARIRVYDIVGVLIRDLTADATGTAVWDGRNQSGSSVASGVYFVLAQGNGETKTIRVAVQR